MAWIMTFHIIIYITIGNFIIPTDEVHHFFRGVAQPPTRLYGELNPNVSRKCRIGTQEFSMQEEPYHP